MQHLSAVVAAQRWWQAWLPHNISLQPPGLSLELQGIELQGICKGDHPSVLNKLVSGVLQPSCTEWQPPTSTHIVAATGISAPMVCATCAHLLELHTTPRDVGGT